MAKRTIEFNIFTHEWEIVEIDKGHKIVAMVRTSEAEALAMSVALELLEALKLNMKWIGRPPIGPDSYDSLREEAWEKGQAAIAAFRIEDRQVFFPSARK